MSKKAFPINRVNIDPPKPVRVAPNPPIALPEREPRNIWVMIGVPALIVALIGTIVMLYVSGVRSLATGFFPLMGIGAFSMLAFSGRFGRARKITWGELEKGRRRYLRDLDTNRDEIQTAVCAQREWQNAVHSDPPGLGAIIGGPRMWERGRGDVDFLEVRVGTGVQHAPDSVLSVTWPDISSDEELEPVTGQALRDFILEQRKIRDIAKVVNLRSAPGFSFVSEDLDRVRSLMRSVLCSLAGVPALADPGTGELVGITDVGARIADVAGVTKHASLQRLPQRVELSAIVEHEAVHQGGDDLSIAFAIGERHELGPVPIKLRESPGLMILGRQGCGKTTALVAIGEAVMNRFSPQQAQLTLIDPKTAPHGLRDLHAPGYVRAYAYDQDEIDEVITELAQQILLPRLPPKGLSQEELRALKPWEGPRHFVLIDDVQDLRPAQSYPQKPPVGAALWKLMERARQVGLHVFSTRNSANWATMPMDPWVKSQTSAKVAQLYMDNDPQNRINRSVRAQTLPPGRGLLVGADGDVEGILVGYPSVPGEQ